MPLAPGRINRGPAAAADNRRAVLAAARRLFAEQGFRVPLSAVAREAGVGQGVLYRHFPTRFDLAFAVFEDNFAELEAAAAASGPGVFAHVWQLLLDLTVDEAAFVEMVIDARRTLPAYDGDERLRTLVGRAICAGHDTGEVDAYLTVETVLLAWRMCFGVVVTVADDDRAQVRAALEAARELLPAVLR
ncbi:TetR/AcrR family transcriptional regulator [Cellulomonas composti]|uniref:TetR family transcriptional regulator n=1 Tax=Cellulomonas composti TaxID=266130 RepID=A0A511J7N7_9CELL|nr:TetR/AcrR family transcriptional regulator [Cellulomonas composti]GEL94010.1 TetR family transcriptional regulator [Cellulomonas composti]